MHSIPKPFDYEKVLVSPEELAAESVRMCGAINAAVDAELWKIIKACISGAPKEVGELTDKEKMAICFCAGVPLSTEVTPDGVKFTTERPVCIMKIDGTYKVFVQSPPR